MSIHTINKVKGWVKRFLPFYLFTFLPLNALAQEQPQRTYTAEHPLIYEDVWDLWPYCFLNEKGEPDGFNVELIKLIFKELDIPYTIKLTSRQEAFNDLKAGKSDLTMALSAGYHDEYGQYGQNTITLFTQSVATPKSKDIEIYNFKDLGKHKVIVNDNSLAHRLMGDFGWSENAIPTKDIREAIRTLSVNEEGQILWNTLSLKWIIHQYQIDNLNITPVNMPHGEYKFMSNDVALLAQLDSIYTVLSTDEKLLAMQNKWFYPERQEKQLPQWVWYVVALVGALTLILLTYVIVYRLQAQRINRQNSRQNKRLALIMGASKLRMWTFDTTTRLFTWHDEDGQPLYHYTAEEFAQRYPAADFQRLKEAISNIEQADSNQHPSPLTLQLKAIDSEDGDDALHDFLVTLSVLRRNKEGRPSVIIGTKKDVTSKQVQQRATETLELRYWSIFNTPMLGILFFNKEGRLTGINQKARTILEWTGLHIDDLQLNYDDVQRRISELRKSIKQRKAPVSGDHAEPLGTFLFCRDVTAMVQKQQQLAMAEDELEQKNKELSRYVTNINYILEKGTMRLASYSPEQHTLTIYHQIGRQQLVLTQARCMTFIDNRHQRKGMHMLSDMDDCINKKQTADIKTTIRARGGLTLYLHFCLYPVLNKEGKVKEYFGFCQDISELKKAESLLREETLKAQEIENTQNKFLRNMLQEIRTPLNVVVELAAQLDEEKPDVEGRNSEIIQNNAQQLLELINNILYISRLEAHMVEINPQPTDFAQVFKAHCQQGWAQYSRDSVRYIVESPYERLVVDIDEPNLGLVIERICTMAAHSTQDGTIRARYDYIGRKLLISVEDTGEGMDADELQHLHHEISQRNNNSKTLAWGICKELIDQMGGTLEINSERGLGTTVWITLPCTATDIKRRKII